MSLSLTKKGPQSYLLDGGESYLEELSFGEEVWLGKRITSKVTSEELEQVRNNVITLLTLLSLPQKEPLLRSFYV